MKIYVGESQCWMRACDEVIDFNEKYAMRMKKVF
jgi:hypothetical protein